jgi:nucleoside-diphosphate-sugar epimerase
VEILLGKFGSNKIRILVTGHNGYIGTVLVPMLVGTGHEVAGLDSDLYERCTFGNGFARIEAIRKDIRDVGASDLAGFDAIVHLAGLSNDPLGQLNPAITHEINHMATMKLARLAKDKGIKRFVFSSSCSNYGAADDSLIDEQAKLNPLTPYGHSKVMAEGDLLSFADRDFSPVLLRCGTAYGVSPRIRFDLVLNNLVAWAYTTGRVFLKSDGLSWRPLVHVEDISRAFMAVINAPRELVHGQAFNVGVSQENFQVFQLARIVQETIPGSIIEYSHDAGRDKRCYRVNCDKLSRTFPDFKPKWNVVLGAKQLVEAFKEYGLRLKDFEGARYKRIDHIIMLIEKGLLDSELRWKQYKYLNE